MEQFSYEDPRQPAPEKPRDVEVRAVKKQPSGSNGLLYAVLAMNGILAVAVVALFLRPAPSPQPGPGPRPKPSVISEDVASMVVEAERNLATYEAEISEQLADAVLKGSIKDSKQFYSMASAAQQKAEDKAFAALNALNAKYVGSEKWNKELVAELQMLKAKGKRMVTK
jgi:hypothetical protein